MLRCEVFSVLPANVHCEGDLLSQFGSHFFNGNKPTEAIILEDWTFAHPTYSFTTTKKVKTVEIDPSKLMADINMNNNRLSVK